MIKVILASVLFSFHFIELGRFGVRWKLPTKPFNCGICLPVWVALGLYWVPEWILDWIIVCFASPIVFVFFSNIFINLNKRMHRDTYQS